MMSAAARLVYEEHVRDLTLDGKFPGRAFECRCLGCRMYRADGEEPGLTTLKRQVLDHLDDIYKSEEEGDRFSWPSDLAESVGWVEP